MKYIALLAFVLLPLSTCLGQQLPHRTYLIPDGTEGEIYIFHGVERGSELETAGINVTFSIPKSRFLVTRWAPDSSPYTSSYFYKDEQGNKRQLEFEGSSIHRTKENLANTRPFAWFLRYSSSSRPGIPCDVKYMQFYVGTRPKMLAISQEERDKEYFRFQSFVEKSVKLLCEGKPEAKTTFIKAN